MIHVRRYFISNHPPKYPALQKSIRDTSVNVGAVWGQLMSRWGAEIMTK